VAAVEVLVVDRDAGRAGVHRFVGAAAVFFLDLGIEGRIAVELGHKRRIGHTKIFGTFW